TGTRPFHRDAHAAAARSTPTTSPVSPTSICGKEGHVAGAAAKIEHAHARDDHPAPTAARHQVVVSWRNEQRNHPEGRTSLRTTPRGPATKSMQSTCPPPRTRPLEMPASPREGGRHAGEPGHGGTTREHAQGG